MDDATTIRVCTHRTASVPGNAKVEVHADAGALATLLVTIGEALRCGRRPSRASMIACRRSLKQRLPHVLTEASDRMRAALQVEPSASILSVRDYLESTRAAVRWVLRFPGDELEKNELWQSLLGDVRRVDEAITKRVSKRRLDFFAKHIMVDAQDPANWIARLDHANAEHTGAHDEVAGHEGSAPVLGHGLDLALAMTFADERRAELAPAPSRKETLQFVREGLHRARVESFAASSSAFASQLELMILQQAKVSPIALEWREGRVKADGGTELSRGQIRNRLEDPSLSVEQRAFALEQLLRRFYMDPVDTLRIDGEVTDICSCGKCAAFFVGTSSGILRLSVMQHRGMRVPDIAIEVGRGFTSLCHAHPPSGFFPNGGDDGRTFLFGGAVDGAVHAFIVSRDGHASPVWRIDAARLRQLSRVGRETFVKAIDTSTQALDAAGLAADRITAMCEWPFAQGTGERRPTIRFVVATKRGLLARIEVSPDAGRRHGVAVKLALLRELAAPAGYVTEMSSTQSGLACTTSTGNIVVLRGETAENVVYDLHHAEAPRGAVAVDDAPEPSIVFATPTGFWLWDCARRVRRDLSTLCISATTMTVAMLHERKYLLVGTSGGKVSFVEVDRILADARTNHAGALPGRHFTVVMTNGTDSAPVKRLAVMEMDPAVGRRDECACYLLVASREDKLELVRVEDERRWYARANDLLAWLEVSIHSGDVSLAGLDDISRFLDIGFRVPKRIHEMLATKDESERRRIGREIGMHVETLLPRADASTLSRISSSMSMLSPYLEPKRLLHLGTAVLRRIGAFPKEARRSLIRKHLTSFRSAIAHYEDPRVTVALNAWALLVERYQLKGPSDDMDERLAERLQRSEVGGDSVDALLHATRLLQRGYDVVRRVGISSDRGDDVFAIHTCALGVAPEATELVVVVSSKGGVRIVERDSGRHYRLFCADGGSEERTEWAPAEGIVRVISCTVWVKGRGIFVALGMTGTYDVRPRGTGITVLHFERMRDGFQVFESSVAEDSNRLSDEPRSAKCTSLCVLSSGRHVLLASFGSGAEQLAIIRKRGENWSLERFDVAASKPCKSVPHGLKAPLVRSAAICIDGKGEGKSNFLAALVSSTGVLRAVHIRTGACRSVVATQLATYRLPPNVSALDLAWNPRRSELVCHVGTSSGELLGYAMFHSVRGERAWDAQSETMAGRGWRLVSRRSYVNGIVHVQLHVGPAEHGGEVLSLVTSCGEIFLLERMRRRSNSPDGLDAPVDLVLMDRLDVDQQVGAARMDPDGRGFIVGTAAGTLEVGTIFGSRGGARRASLESTAERLLEHVVERMHGLLRGVSLATVDRREARELAIAFCEMIPTSSGSLGRYVVGKSFSMSATAYASEDPMQRFEAAIRYLGELQPTSRPACARIEGILRLLVSEWIVWPGDSLRGAGLHYPVLASVAEYSYEHLASSPVGICRILSRVVRDLFHIRLLRALGEAQVVADESGRHVENLLSEFLRFLLQTRNHDLYLELQHAITDMLVSVRLELSGNVGARRAEFFPRGVHSANWLIEPLIDNLRARDGVEMFDGVAGGPGLLALTHVLSLFPESALLVCKQMGRVGCSEEVFSTIVQWLTEDPGSVPVAALVDYHLSLLPIQRIWQNSQQVPVSSARRNSYLGTFLSCHQRWQTILDGRRRIPGGALECHGAPEASERVMDLLDVFRHFHALWASGRDDGTLQQELTTLTNINAHGVEQRMNALQHEMSRITQLVDFIHQLSKLTETRERANAIRRRLDDFSAVCNPEQPADLLVGGILQDWFVEELDGSSRINPLVDGVSPSRRPTSASTTLSGPRSRRSSRAPASGAHEPLSLRSLEHSGVHPMNGGQGEPLSSRSRR